MLSRLGIRVPSIPIRYAVPGLLAVLIVAAVGLTAWLAFQSGQLSASEEAKHLSGEVAQRVQERVISFLDVPREFNEINLAAVKAGDINPKNLDDLARHFWYQVYISPSVPYLYYADQQGDFVGINTDYGGVGEVYKIVDQKTFPDRLTYRVDQNGHPIGQPIQNEPYDARTRPWYQDAVKAGKPAWTKIYTFAAKHNLGISAVAPVYDKNRKLEGALGIDLTLVNLTDFLRNLKPSPNGKSFIVEQGGLLVATSSAEDPYTTRKTVVNGKSVKEQRRLMVIDSRDPLIHAAAAYLVQTYGGFDRISFRKDPATGAIASRSFVFNFNGQTELGQVSPVNDRGGISWLVVVVIPANDFMGRVYDNIRTTFILGLVVLLVASVLGFLLAGRIIQPILKVSEVAAGIEKGSYSLERLDPVVVRTDELGQLARVFKRMANEVYTREQQLQRQVALLKVEIDEVKRQKEVEQIVDSDQFRALRARAEKLRAQRNRTTPVGE